jgi:hypothetical protein
LPTNGIAKHRHDIGYGHRLCEGASTAGGWVLVTAVKVNELNGGATIVVRNLHPTQTMTTTFSVNFIVFNSS